MAAAVIGLPFKKQESVSRAPPPLRPRPEPPPVGKRLNPGPTPGLGKAAPGVCEGRGLAATTAPPPRACEWPDQALSSRHISGETRSFGLTQLHWTIFLFMEFGLFSPKEDARCNSDASGLPKLAWWEGLGRGSREACGAKDPACSSGLGRERRAGDLVCGGTSAGTTVLWGAAVCRREKARW